MKILFCNIANMKYYKGNIPGVDEPQYGGEYVQQWGDGGEVYNFFPTPVDGENVCLGFVETKSTNRKTVNQLHVEKIEGVFPEDAPEAEGVLVIWCAIHNNYDNSGRTAVMGWYRNATVYREYQKIPVSLEDGGTELATYNIKANTCDCVLLPYGERNDHVWWVPRKRKTRSFGFGQANVWFAQEERAEEYVHKLVQKIDSYRGENWLWEPLPEKRDK